MLARGLILATLLPGLMAGVFALADEAPPQTPPPTADSAAQPAAPATAPAPEPEVIRLRLQPQLPPKASLRYHLLPPRTERTPGNAAPLYYRAILTSERAEFKELHEKASDWLNLPLQELPVAEIREQLKRLQPKMAEVALAARRERCEWDLPLQGENAVSLTLEELQGMRSLARLLGLQTRLQLRDRQFDAALQTLQTGFAMAQHVAEVRCLVGGLVGIAIANQLLDRVQEMSELPGAPNLYWALAALPDPLIDLRPALDFEANLGFEIFPMLRDAETAQRTHEEWSAQLDKLVGRLGEDLGVGEVNVEQMKSKLTVSIRNLMMYPQVRKYLLEERGFAVDRVDQISPAQAILIYTADQYRQSRDSVFRWLHVPYWQAERGLGEMDQELKRLKAQEVIPVGQLLLPAIGRIALAQARGQRRIAELQILESLRAYAQHEGRLPESLADLVDAPAPLDPVTGAPFEYRLIGETAVLEVPAPRGASSSMKGKRFELSVTKPAK